MDSLDREIKKKLIILANRRPFPLEVGRYIAEMNQLDWIYGSMKLDGSTITREGAAKIAGGDYIRNASLDDHTTIFNYLETFRLIYYMAGMKVNLDEKNLKKLYQVLEYPEAANYRSNNPVLHTLAYNPPFFRDIPEQLAQLFRWFHTDKTITNPMRKAVLLHHQLIKIYPFSYRMEALARIALYYQLVRSGYPPFCLDIGEQQYYSMLRDYLKSDTIEEFYSIVERGVYRKVELMMRLTAK